MCACGTRPLSTVSGGLHPEFSPIGPQTGQPLTDQVLGCAGDSASVVLVT